MSKKNFVSLLLAGVALRNLDTSYISLHQSMPVSKVSFLLDAFTYVYKAVLMLMCVVLQYTWTTDRLWRKNRRTVRSQIGRDKPCVGVDINRNFPEGWKKVNTLGLVCMLHLYEGVRCYIYVLGHEHLVYTFDRLQTMCCIYAFGIPTAVMCVI